MKRLLNLLVDKFQATFPPNRLMIALAGPITAASVWLSAWTTAHIPGVELPVGIVAGAIGAAALITITLIYKWFDQWQRHEHVDFGGDLDLALEEFLDNPEAHAAFIDQHPDLFADLMVGAGGTVAPVSSTEETS